MSHHEFWRDEVRALSLVRHAVSPLSLFDLLKNEGHPALWYVLLYLAHLVSESSLVLPITSIAVAFAAIAVFVYCAPFPLWFRILFMFGVLPFYEYSVTTRNYGISMLLLFAWAALYQYRARHPSLLMIVLALLANTNVHSALLACVAMGIWIWDSRGEPRDASLGRRILSTSVPILIGFGGLLAAAAVAMPDRNTIVTNAYGLGTRDLAYFMVAAVKHPGQSFREIMPGGQTLPLWARDALIYTLLLGLIRQPQLFGAALAGQIGLGIIFRGVYPGSLRHQGLFLVFMLSLYWIAIQSYRSSHDGIRHALFKLGLYVALVMLLVAGVSQASLTVLEDLHAAKSSSKAFGRLLTESQTYHDAIIVSEPDYLVESLPYYAKNSLYLPREHRFNTTVSFTTASQHHLSLGELLQAARDIKARSERPVLIVLGRKTVSTSETGTTRSVYKRTFSWTPDELAEFKRRTEIVADFNDAVGDENYRVYAVR